MYQWKGIESSEINLYIYGQLIFVKGTKAAQRRNDGLFNKWCWANWVFTRDRMTLDPLPHTTHTQINAKWIAGLNVKLRGKNTEGNLHDPDRPDSLDNGIRSMVHKNKHNNKLDFIQIKNSAPQKITLELSWLSLPLLVLAQVVLSRS